MSFRGIIDTLGDIAKVVRRPRSLLLEDISGFSAGYQ
jgi:hypothetical protein